MMGTVYSIVQYVPDPIAGERINIGLIAVEEGRAACRFLDNWDRVNCFGSGADVEWLTEFATSIQLSCKESTMLVKTTPELTMSSLRRMSEQWTYSIQLSQPSPSLLRCDQLIEDLAPLMLKDIKSGQPARKTFRDRRTLVLDATDHLSRALIRRASGRESAREYVRSSYPYMGNKKEHRLDVAVAFDRVYFGAFAISFEIPTVQTLEVLSDRLLWKVSDLRAAHPDDRFAVVVYPPLGNGHADPKVRELYFDTSRICESFAAPFVTQTQFEEMSN